MSDWLGGSERQRVMEIGWNLAASRDEDELGAAAAQELLTFVGADEVDYNVVDLVANRVRVGVFPQSDLAVDIQSQLSSVVAEHPVIRYLERANQILPVRLSDLVAPERFFRTNTYEVLFRPRDLRFQMVAPVQVNKTIRAGAAYAINRSMRDFEELDLHLAAAVQPVIGALHAALLVRQPSEENLAAARMRAGLTRREVEILSMVASGMTADAIGRARRISVRTVRKHLENAYGKLGTHDRLQAVAYCRRTGILQTDAGSATSVGETP